MRLPALIALACATPALAAPPAGRCVTPAQLEALTRFALPPALDAAVQRCRTMLPAGSFTAREGAALAARYRQATPPGFPEAARQGFEALAGQSLPAELDSDVLGAIVGTTVAGMVSKVSPADCAKIDRLLEATAPLPAANAATLVALVIELGAAKDRKLPVCAPAGR